MKNLSTPRLPVHLIINIYPIPNKESEKLIINFLKYSFPSKIDSFNLYLNGKEELFPIERYDLIRHSKFYKAIIQVLPKVTTNLIIHNIRLSHK